METKPNREEPPYDYPGMVFYPGRYYYGMVMCPIAPFGPYPNGADITGMLWRYDATPNEWIYTYRIRKYATTNRAWDGRDKKSWYGMKIDGDEASATTKIKAAMLAQQIMTAEIFSGVMKEPEWFLIQGDSEKAFDLLQKSPPEWMHMRKGTMDEKGNVTSMETDLKDEPAQ